MMDLIAGIKNAFSSMHNSLLSLPLLLTEILQDLNIGINMNGDHSYEKHNISTLGCLMIATSFVAITMIIIVSYFTYGSSLNIFHYLRKSSSFTDSSDLEGNPQVPKIDR